ncbi:MAG: IS66 family transposase [Mesorhizobium sp.]|nr:transposase [Mesorhizobium sp.]TIN32415.1 MAG: IS66 family transposase [Mesorhizobium sp.]TJU83694.1 MAG: IS66 family transposase [Mesorhizobium sp.]
MRVELEDLEADFASVPDIELPIVADTDRVRVLPVRKLNPNLPRKRVVREPSCACCLGCGGDLRAMGQDSDEMPDLVAYAWQVIETIRPKYSCRTCDKIIQAPAPIKAIAKLSCAARALAHSAGYAAALLDPIYNRPREIGRTRTKIHTDNTRLPILAPSAGKTHKGALWVYVADDRNSGSQEPSIARYCATIGRAGESVMTELAGCAGTLQADGFSGYNQIYNGGAIREAACLAHLHRKIFDVHDRQPTELSATAMAGIQAIYRSRNRNLGSRPPSDWPHDEGAPDHWSARCDDSSSVRARVCRAMPRSRRPSPMAPNDGARLTGSSAMASSSLTT